MKINNNHRKHIIVIGGGFAGLNFIQQLFDNKLYTVTLVDRNNYNYFTPLLYQVATSFLEPSSISYPFRKFLKNKGVTFRNAKLIRVDPALNKVYLSDSAELYYDYLVFAAGTKTNFFGNESIRKNAFSLKGIDDALFMRNEMIKALEKASVENDPLLKQKLLTIVIAGGGPTGVELAGMFAEMKKHIIGTDYPELKNDHIEIHLIDAAPHLLSSMSERTHQDVYEVLVNLGVHVRLSTMVTRYENDRVYLSDGDHINTRTLIWCAGVIANRFDGISQQSLGKGMRMITDQHHMVEGYDNIFAIGDISIQFHDENYPGGHPQIAQPAIQQGKTLARNLLFLAKGRPMKPFTYFDRGDMAIVGRSFAVADLFKHKVHLNGIPGLLSWLFIHLISLVNYNNKIKTFYNWTVAYITCDQALRMIFRSDNKENERDETITKLNHHDYAEQD
ncbi:MAG: FAD-dependent oxidoreductase [Marivirga sp.]|nr:FAD-dependent oxidoreductase [Marivirga sp.]